MKKKKKDELAKKIANELQIPEEALTSSYRIEFRGNSDVSVEGCQGIVEYDESVISLNLGKCIVRFRGSDLEIDTFFETQAVIRGTVAAMEFSS